jgi:hypothetical protein
MGKVVLYSFLLTLILVDKADEAKYEKNPILNIRVYSNFWYNQHFSDSYCIKTALVVT